MVAYNFQAEFSHLVETFEKRQTVRPIGKRRHARPGDPVQLYTGMRTRACRKLAEAMCTGSAKVRIERDPSGLPAISLEGQRLDPLEAYAFTVADGFSSVADLVSWFDSRYGLPFEGVCIQW